MAADGSTGSPRTIFATSMAEPPPTPRISPGSTASATAQPRSTSGRRGFGLTSVKKATSRAASSGRTPDRSTPVRLPTTRIGRAGAPTSSGSRRTLPRPCTTSTSVTAARLPGTAGAARRG